MTSSTTYLNNAVINSDDPLSPENMSISSKEVCLFLTRYAVSLLGCGATCMRLERNIDRMAAVFGKKVELTIMPRHVHMTVWHPGSDDFFTSISSVRPAPISFSLNTRLSELSWAVADNRLPLEEAKERFRKTIDSDFENPWITLLLASCANAAFCGIFGGDAIAMAIVFIATALGFNLKQVLVRKHVDSRLVFFVCAFVSSVIGATDYLFPYGGTPAVAVGTSVLYLVPGIPFLNSFNDLIYHHYICAVVRFIDAMVLTGCLSLGLCLGMKLMHVGMF